MKEQWKDTHVFGEYYQVSNFGNVRSKNRYVRSGHGATRIAKGKVLKPYDTCQGYKMVTLGFNCKQSNIFVHRLVAFAFLDNPHNKPIINHKDSNKQNNHVDNIEWCNKLENYNHARAAGAIPKINGENSGCNKINNNTASQIKKLLSEGVPRVQVAKAVGTTYSIVYAISIGFTWKHIPAP